MRAGFVALLLLSAAPSMAQVPMADVPLASAVQEEQARQVMAELRCLTCQNQSIADSQAPQAESMRAEVRARIEAGDDPETVRLWFVERYGDWVSFVPPARSDTALLWAAPLLFMALGIAIFWRRYKR